MSEKEWYCDINLKFSQIGSAESKEEFVDRVKETFKDEFDLDITNKEIANIQENV